MASDDDADDEDDIALLHKWAHSVRKASSSRQRKLKKVHERINVLSDSDLARLEKLLTSSVNKNVAPPLSVYGKVWAMLDSGSQPTVANCKQTFPHHPLEESEGQRRGLKYKVADGTLVPNEGQVHVTHRDGQGKSFQFTFQHANVHCPILSVSELVNRDCIVTFHKMGGHIQYPDGRKIRFIAKEGVFFFVELNVVDPDFHRRGSH